MAAGPTGLARLPAMLGKGAAQRKGRCGRTGVCRLMGEVCNPRGANWIAALTIIVRLAAIYSALIGH